MGSDHLSVDIDSVVNGMATLFGVITGKTPLFRVRTDPFSYPCIIASVAPEPALGVQVRHVTFMVNTMQFGLIRVQMNPAQSHVRNLLS